MTGPHTSVYVPTGADTGTRYGVAPQGAEWYYCLPIDVDGETTYVDGYAIGERPTVATLQTYAACAHEWQAGLMVVAPEDLATVATMRDPADIDCARCGVTYPDRDRPPLRPAGRIDVRRIPRTG